MKKISKYTRYYILEDIHILYNMISDCFIALELAEFSDFFENRFNIVRIEDINPKLYETLVKYNIIVDESICEEQNLIESWHHADSDPEYVKITILPTLQCNLRCWYCYEDHNNNSILNKSTAIGINKLIHQIVSASSLQKFNLDFFGGEPLLLFEETVAPIIIYANKVCKENRKRLGISFTTNGVLLNDNVCQLLANANADVSFQITLDGNQDCHNQIRFLPGNRPTYKLIVSNIKRAVRAGFYVSVRFNYTHKNYYTYSSVISDFEDLTEQEKKLLDFSFHKVWQEARSIEVESFISNTIRQYLSKGYDVNIPSYLGNKDRCYADGPKNLVINYNGDIYKCTARDFDPAMKEGTLQPDGSIVWNNRYHDRLKLIYGMPVCQQCAIFPLCNCGCSQNRLEYSHESCNCPYGYSSEEKENIIRDRVYTLLSRFVTPQN